MRLALMTEAGTDTTAVGTFPNPTFPVLLNWEDGVISDVVLCFSPLVTPEEMGEAAAVLKELSLIGDQLVGATSAELLTFLLKNKGKEVALIGEEVKALDKLKASADGEKHYVPNLLDDMPTDLEERLTVSAKTPAEAKEAAVIRVARVAAEDKRLVAHIGRWFEAECPLNEIKPADHKYISINTITAVQH